MSNGDDAREDGRGAIEKRTRIFLEDLGGEQRPLVDKVERTGLGLGGMTQEVEIRLIRASACSHIIHTGSEAGSVCGNPDCNNVLCSRCAGREENLCTECGRSICGSCRRNPWPLGKDSVLCPACARRFWLKELSIAMGVAALVFVALWVLFSR